MKRYWLVVVGVMVVFLITFILFEKVVQIPLLQDPSNVMQAGTIGAAFLGVGLLVVDVFLPVPSSIVMILHGALFGVVVGTLLSVIGGLGASLVGFWLGRQGETLLSRWITEEEAYQANQLLKRWGWLAIIVTRPIPILAETVAIMAGASTISWRLMALAGLAGAIPAGMLYAITGATALNLDNFLLTFGFVMLMAGLFWLIGRSVQTKLMTSEPNKGI